MELASAGRRYTAGQGEMRRIFNAHLGRDCGQHRNGFVWCCTQFLPLHRVRILQTR
jgi:hypothetical protein